MIPLSQHQRHRRWLSTSLDQFITATNNNDLYEPSVDKPSMSSYNEMMMNTTNNGGHHRGLTSMTNISLGCLDAASTMNAATFDWNTYTDFSNSNQLNQTSLQDVVGSAQQNFLPSPSIVSYNNGNNNYHHQTIYRTQTNGMTSETTEVSSENENTFSDWEDDLESIADSMNLLDEEGKIAADNAEEKQDVAADAVAAFVGSDSMQESLSRCSGSNLNFNYNPFDSSHFRGSTNLVSESSTTSSTADSNSVCGGSGDNISHTHHVMDGMMTPRFREYQASQWSERFEELLAYKKMYGHCCVPHTSKNAPLLGRWVKRQRYQYKLWQEGRSESTMTKERIDALEKIGFLWESHEGTWEARYNELREFYRQNGHCNVSSNYVNSKLATWVKYQRRQYKTQWMNGNRKAKNNNVANRASSPSSKYHSSSLTWERVQKLEALGFEWQLRRGRS